MLGLLEQCVPGESPARGIRGADQTPGEMGRTVGGTVENGKVVLVCPAKWIGGVRSASNIVIATA